jgi:hypothetical protein
MHIALRLPAPPVSDTELGFPEAASIPSCDPDVRYWLAQVLVVALITDGLRVRRFVIFFHVLRLRWCSEGDSKGLQKWQRSSAI